MEHNTHCRAGMAHTAIPTRSPNLEPAETPAPPSAAESLLQALLSWS